MEFKHSPAPWRCHDKRPNCSGYSIVGNDGQYIAFVGDSDELSPVDANAHLIAAAPDLLDVLIECRKWVLYKELQDKADLAITKALGEKNE